MRNVQRLVVLLLVMVLTSGCAGPDDSDLPFDADKYVEFGKQSLNQKPPNLKLAVKMFQRALEKDPKHFDALISLGDTHMAMAKKEQVLAIKKRNSKKKNDNLDNNTSGLPEGVEETEALNDEQKKKILNHIEQAGELYGRAHEMKPDSPYPEYKWGRLLFWFRNLLPDRLSVAKSKLESALEKFPEDRPIYRARSYYFLGGILYLMEHQKPPEKRDFCPSKEYLLKYLNTYPNQPPPREKAIENLLMKIDKRMPHADCSNQ